MSTPKLVPTPKNCDVTVRQAIQKLASKLGPGGEPTYAGLTLTGLTASRLLASNASKALVSSNLASWVTQTANQVLVTDDGDGTITLSAPQDIHTGASPMFAGLKLESGVFIKEQAAADADTAAYGQIWVKTATPNELWFTDDVGTDYQLGDGEITNLDGGKSDSDYTVIDMSPIDGGDST